MIALMEEVSPAVLEKRIALQQQKARFIAFCHDVSIHVRQLWSGEDGTKTVLKRLRTGMDDLQQAVNRFSDTNRTEVAIAASIEVVQSATADLLALDAPLDWYAGNVQKACAAFMRALNDKTADAPAKQVEPGAINPKRMALLDAIDELSASIMTLGSLEHGGIAERKPAVLRALELRQAVHADLTRDLSDRATLIPLVNAVKTAVGSLALLQSRLTHQTGFMTPAIARVQTQCDRILEALALPVPRPRNSLSIKP